MPQGEFTRSSGNVFANLGFPPEEVAVLSMRAELMVRLRLVIKRKRWTAARAAQMLSISKAQERDLVRGKWDKFSLDLLVTLAGRAGLEPRLQLKRAA